MGMGIRDKLFNLIAPDEARKAKDLDVFEQLIRNRLAMLPLDVVEECTKRHANGPYGWFCMKLGSPFRALMWAHEIEIQIASNRLSAPTPSPDPQRIG